MSLHHILCMSQEKECRFHSLYTVVPLVTQFLGLDKPSIWKRPVALLSYFGLPLIEDPRLLKWDFALSLQERRVLIDEMYEMLAPILFGRGVHRSSGNTVHHGELRDPDVRGWIIVSNNSTQQLIESHKLRRAKILQCAQLAEQLGAETVGMAELIASFGQGGYYLSERFPKLGFTTGHAYTIRQHNCRQHN